MKQALWLAAAIVGAALSAPNSIRSVDFANFSFPLWECESGQACSTVELVDGEGSWEDWEGAGYTLRAHLGFVRYGDVTGDGRDEALVRLGQSAGGTGQFSQLLVYSQSGSEVELVHRFPSGDRAHGSYVDACVVDGRLAVVRQYGESCMVCVEAIETTEYVWTEHGPELSSRHLEPHPGPDQGQCGLFNFETVCGNRPYEHLFCRDRATLNN